MKNLVIIFLTAASLVACTNEKQEAELAKMRKENNELIKLASKKNGEIVRFKEQLVDIHENLRKIKEQEQLISASAIEGDLEMSKETIARDLNTLGELLASNRDKIASLEGKLKHRDMKLDEFAMTVDLLKEQIDERQKQLELLVDELAVRDIEIAGLQMANDDLVCQIYEMDDDANRVYYTVGETKALMENDVVERKSGLQGLFGAKQLDGQLNTTQFVATDKRELSEIPIGSSKAELVSTHPQSSYAFVGEKEVESLKILNPDEFWSQSNYLAIAVRQ